MAPIPATAPDNSGNRVEVLSALSLTCAKWKFNYPPLSPIKHVLQICTVRSRDIVDTRHLRPFDAQILLASSRCRYWKMGGTSSLKFAVYGARLRAHVWSAAEAVRTTATECGARHQTAGNHLAPRWIALFCPPLRPRAIGCAARWATAGQPRPMCRARWPRCPASSLGQNTGVGVGGIPIPSPTVKSTSRPHRRG
jgi:hypothetical protein